MKYIVKQTGQKGLGIYASQKIAAYEVIAKVDYAREVTPDQPLHEGESYDHQMYLPDGRVFLVAEPICYFNHSCGSNAFLYSADQQYYIISKHTIPADKEITIDYELSAVNGDTWECKCGSKNCRGLHTWDFFSLPKRIILESLPYLDPWFAQVHGNRIKHVLNQ